MMMMMMMMMMTARKMLFYLLDVHDVINIMHTCKEHFKILYTKQSLFTFIYIRKRLTNPLT